VCPVRLILLYSYTIEKANSLELLVELDYTLEDSERMLALSSTLVSILNILQSQFGNDGMQGPTLGMKKIIRRSSSDPNSQPSEFASEVNETIFYLFQVCFLPI
jgi:hypothetical protein